MAYSLILSCCCCTCCIRRKLRKMLNITGGFVDYFLSHLMCCCCALVQEWREVEIRGVYGTPTTEVGFRERKSSKTLLVMFFCQSLDAVGSTNRTMRSNINI